MRHRLYYLLPDIESARRTHDDMLLSRIEERHIRFMTGGDTVLPPDLPEASFLHKTDIVRGAESGLLVGAGLGVTLGVVVVAYFDLASKPAAVIMATLVGMLFGGWAASMAAAALPNSRLKNFYPELEKGKLLLIVDVPARRVQEIENLLKERHPETSFSGEEPKIPVFP